MQHIQGRNQDSNLGEAEVLCSKIFKKLEYLY